MRMFVAVQPPIEVTEDLNDYLEPRRERDSPLRWTSDDQWHLTLAFMPKVADRNLDELVDNLAEAAAKRAPFELGLEGVGTFPNSAQAKVLYAGVTGNLEQLGLLATSARSAASRAGTEVDGGTFRPHITLARTKPLDVTRWLRVLDLYRGPNWQVTELALIQSELGAGPRGHSRYRVHETFELKGT